VNPWIYQNQPFTETPELYQGFVYLITNLTQNRYYIGKKNYWKTIKRAPLKGRVNRRHSRTATDWQDYWGSSTALQKHIDLLGVDCFRREILIQCRTKTDMSYHETRLQFQENVLTNPAYYNDYIGCRITSRGLTT